VVLEYEHHTQVFTSFGAKGRKAEAVAGAAAREARRYLEGEVVACEHLADQLLLPFALAGGGRVRCGEPTLHARTQLELVGELLEVDARAKQVDEELWELRVGR
jgi:RNA 3'-terminal phosphate cyclase (ATP)